jgi:hypothetical protein
MRNPIGSAKPNGRPRKATEDTFYDVFSAFPLTEQRIVLRVLERLVIEREKDASRAAGRAFGNAAVDQVLSDGH